MKLMRYHAAAIAVVAALNVQASDSYEALGTFNINPSGNAPLTALIKKSGQPDINKVTVTVAGKGKNGLPISYDVTKESLRHYNGVPVFGLYPDHNNTVTVDYMSQGKQNQQTFNMFTQPINGVSVDGSYAPYESVNPVKVKEGFEDRLYWVNNIIKDSGDQHGLVRNKGGAFEWTYAPVNFITDTQGDIRWYLKHDNIFDTSNPDKVGVLQGVKQTASGDIIFAQGQRYYRMDMLGNMIYERRLPEGYTDFSHEIRELDNGNILIRVAKKDYVRPDGDVVSTVRDHIIEVDQHGKVIDVWDLNTILDPLRDDLLKALDRGAVCLNVDLDSAGQTMEIEPDAPYGDSPGIGTGRNWAHVNSVDYDPTDDSIVLSVRHQGSVKIGRDKEVKWILSPRAGWKNGLEEKVLTPINANGTPIHCTESGLCDGDEFEFSYMQHTAWLAKEKGTLLVFDNGDARHLEQPPFQSMKYSRAVEYKIDMENMTVQQLWQYGKERGYEWYSPITSSVNYEADKDTYLIYAASAGLFEPEKKWPYYVMEVGYGTDDVKVELEIHPSAARNIGYQAININVDVMF
ncbi:aryl-sulfate sulfotransferase [Ferrimonas pelagia]|uniref:Aryl-sulfate sulfotransferase n=1 Tax=Ferrimonas pelagia TaxID=1177826 RepID=A0ABP9EFH6_9GAMM